MGSYVVQAGDSWAKIAGKLYDDQRNYLRLMEANSGVSVLTPGTTINAPSSATIGQYNQANLEKTTGKDKPFISNVNWALSTGQSGNSIGANIVGQEQYTPSPFGQALQSYAASQGMTMEEAGDLYGAGAMVGGNVGGNMDMITFEDLAGFTGRGDEFYDTYNEDRAAWTPPEEDRYDFGPDNMGFQYSPPPDLSGAQGPGASSGDPVDQFIAAQGPMTGSQRDQMKDAIEVLGLDVTTYTGQQTLQELMSDGKLMSEYNKALAFQENREYNILGPAVGPLGALAGSTELLAKLAWQLYPAIFKGALYKQYENTLKHQEKEGIQWNVYQVDENGQLFWGPMHEQTLTNMTDHFREQNANMDYSMNFVHQFQTPDGDTVENELPSIGVDIFKDMTQDIIYNNGRLMPESAEKYSDMLWEDAAAQGLDLGDPLQLAEYMDGMTDSNKEMLLRSVEIAQAAAFAGGAENFMEDMRGNPLMEFWPANPLTGEWYGGEYDPYLGGRGFLPYNRSGGGGQQFVFSPSVTHWSY